MKDIVDLAVSAAREAGELLMRDFGSPLLIEEKGDRDLATHLDKASEKIITDRIKSAFPGHGILAEEGGSYETGCDYLWIIDPLDGTHNYIRNIDIFGVSIGVAYKEEFVAGVIFIPVGDEMYTAEKGSGACKNGSRIKTSGRVELKSCSISFDSNFRHSPEVMARAFKALSEEVFNTRVLGSSARVLSYISEGKLDGSIEFYDLPWDFAAGACILKEAGGDIRGFDGSRINHMSRGYIASNGLIQDKLNGIISKAEKKDGKRG